MVEEGGLLKCKICGSVLEKVYQGPKTGKLDDLEELTPKHEGEGSQKHVPVLERDGDNVVIKVSEITHPMEIEHHICFIELIDGNTTYRKTLKAGEEPKAIFKIDTDINSLKAREYCNVHGLWES
ncbi:MAG: desulfoferrodoxin [Methanobrevibacter sp.]|jgi:superoxide reductase|nr:desulfoferrodoxin [Candidatus Methanovirga basalitermitum]